MKLPPFMVVDWEKKLAALIFAGLIWYSVHMQLSDHKDLHNLPVTFITGEHLTLLDDKEENIPRVSVTIQGSQKEVRMAGSGDLRVSYSVPPTARPGVHEVHLRPRDVSLPRGVRVKEIKPAVLTIKLDSVMTRDDVDVRLRLGQPSSPNLRIKTSMVTPRKVSVSGPRSLVESLKELNTELVPLEEIGQQMEFEQDIRLLGHERLRITPDRVRVRVELVKVLTEKAFLKLPLQILQNSAGGLMVESFVDPVAPQVDVNIEGPQDITDYLTASSVRAFIDLSDMTTVGVFQMPVQVWVNAKDCTLLSSSPRMITVKLARQQVSPRPRP